MKNKDHNYHINDKKLFLTFLLNRRTLYCDERDLHVQSQDGLLSPVCLHPRRHAGDNQLAVILDRQWHRTSEDRTG